MHNSKKSCNFAAGFNFCKTTNINCTMINPVYSPSEKRYDCGMQFRRCGRSGVLLPEISLGLWHNFGDTSPFDNSLRMAHYAFDHGIVHFDLANNYGPSYGSAEETFGAIMTKSFTPYRDELFISTKAGHDMWPGPYGEWGSRKYLMASLDQSLRRMKLDYVDLFYSHRFDPETRWRRRFRRWWTSFGRERLCMSASPSIRRRLPDVHMIICAKGTCPA